MYVIIVFNYDFCSTPKVTFCMNIIEQTYYEQYTWNIIRKASVKYSLGTDDSHIMNKCQCADLWRSKYLQTLLNKKIQLNFWLKIFFLDFPTSLFTNFANFTHFCNDSVEVICSINPLLKGTYYEKINAVLFMTYWLLQVSMKVSTISEAFVSLKRCFVITTWPLIINRFKYSTTHWCVTRR